MKASELMIGDWIVDEDDNSVHQIKCVLENVTSGNFSYDLVGGGYFPSIKKNYHLWSIKDAKDGDVLHSTGWHNDCIFIFNGLDNWKFDEPNGDRAVATGYCCLSVSADNMEFGIQGPDCVEVNTIKPATKIQRDLLFQKMHEAGYMWDSKSKQLLSLKAEPSGKQKPTEWSIEDKSMYVRTLGILGKCYMGQLPDKVDEGNA